MSDHVELLEAVLSAARETVDATAESQLGLATPCAEWDVLALIGHMVGSLYFCSSVVSGVDADSGSAEGADLLGNDPSAAFAAAVDATLAAFRAPGVLDAEWETPAGVMSGASWIMFPTWDQHVHHWDLATATGREVKWDEDVTGRVLQWGTQAFGTGERNVEQIGHRLDAPQGASTVEQLAAFFGRTP